MASIPTRAALVAGLLTLPSQGLGQADTGLQATLDLSQRLEYENDDDNDVGANAETEENGLQTVTRLDFSLQSVTRAQVLSFQAGTGIEYRFSGDDDFQVESPIIQLDYVRSSRDAQFSFGGLYQRTEVDESAFIEDPLTGDVELATSGGFRQNFELNTELSLRQTAPIGIELGHFYQRVRYSDTADPSLNESDFNAVDAALRFRFSPTLTSRLFVNASQRDEEGLEATDIDRYSVGVGTEYLVSPILFVTANVSYDSTEEEEIFETPLGSIPIVESYEGLGLNFGVNRALPSGSVGLSAQRTQGINGTRNQFRINRGFEWTRTEFGLSVGATKTDGFSAQPLVSASFSRDVTQRSSLAAEISQTSQVSEDEEESVLTRADLDYNFVLTPVSSLNAGIELVRQKIITDDRDEISARLDIAYRHALTRDWDFVSGMSFTTTQEDNGQSSESQRIFGGLERSFSFLP